MDGKDEQDHGAGLIGQVAAELAETEPRLTLEQSRERLWAAIGNWAEADTNNRYPECEAVDAAIDALIAAVRSELVAYFIERHQSLTAREIKEAIADIQRANVSAATRSDAVVLPEGEKPASQDWEPSGKCQYDACDGERFNYDSTDSRWGSWFCVKCGGMQIPPEYETGNQASSSEIGSVPSAAPKIVFCYGADAAIAALKDHSTVLHEGETTPGCTGRSAAPKEPS